MLSRVPFTWPRSVVVRFFSSPVQVGVVGEHPFCGVRGNLFLGQEFLVGELGRAFKRCDGPEIPDAAEDRAARPVVRKDAESRLDWAAAAVDISSAHARLLAKNVSDRLVMVRTS